MENATEVLIDVNEIFRPVIGSSQYGIKYMVWLLRQIANLDPYWKRVLQAFLNTGKIPRDLYEIILTTNKTHILDTRELKEVYEVDGRSFQFFLNKSRKYFEVVDDTQKSLISGTDISWLKQNLRQIVFKEKIASAAKLKRILSEILDFKRGVYMEKHIIERIQKSDYGNWPKDRIKEELRKIDLELKRLVKSHG